MNPLNATLSAVQPVQADQIKQLLIVVDSGTLAEQLDELVQNALLNPDLSGRDIADAFHSLTLIKKLWKLERERYGLE